MPHACCFLLLLAACSIDARVVTTVDAAEAVGESSPCVGIPVQRDLITDFSDAFAAPDLDGNPGVRFGEGPVQRGGISYIFAAPSLKPPRLSLEPRGNDLALRIDAVPGVPINGENFYVGVALGFSNGPEVCVDATGYNGVTFTLDGSTGSCQLMFQVQISHDYRIGPNTQVASCTLGEQCYPPYSPPLVVDGRRSYAIAFEDLTRAGNPVPTVDVKTLTNVGWKLFAPLSGPPCVASLVLDDVAFFR